MGQILSQPVVEKHSDEHKDKYLAYGISCMQGWRINMEDAHATILNLYDLPLKKSLSSNSEQDEDEKMRKRRRIRKILLPPTPQNTSTK